MAGDWNKGGAVDGRWNKGGFVQRQKKKIQWKNRRRDVGVYIWSIDLQARKRTRSSPAGPQERGQVN